MRTAFMALVATGLLSVAAGSANACSQCMCGTAFPADVLGGVVPTQFTYGLEERYLSKENGLDDGPGIEEEREHRIAGFGMWRPINQLALLARLPFNQKEIATTPLGEATTTETSHGIGDAELLAMAGVYHSSGARPLSVGLVMGGAAPTGSSDAKNANGERLDQHLQPGSGAWSGTGGVHAALSASSGIWDVSALGRANGTNAQGYHYGNALLYNAGFTSNLWHGLRALAQVNGRVAKQDLQDDSFAANTGGTVTYLAPGIRFASSFGLGIEGAVQIPVSQSLYGVQKEHTTARLTLSMAH